MQSSSRNGARVRLLAVHTTEGIMRARDLIAFFNRADAAGSSHAGADETGALLGPEAGYVPYDRSAWTLRNGNPVSDNLEFCGWARWTRADWLARPAGLEAIARWLADRSKARGIPLVKLSPADVRAGRSGVIGHVDWTQGMNDGTHWDPGPGFPWDVVIDRARQIAGGTPPPAPPGDTDMRVLRTPDGTIWLATDTEVAPITNIRLAQAADKVWGGTAPVSNDELVVLRDDADARRGRRADEIAIAAAKLVGTPDVDEAAIVAGLTGALSGRAGLSSADVEAAVRNVLREGTGTAA